MQPKLEAEWTWYGLWYPFCWVLLGIVTVLWAVAALQHRYGPQEGYTPPALIEASMVVEGRLYADLPTGSVYLLVTQGAFCYVTQDEYLAVALGDRHTCLWKEAK